MTGHDSKDDKATADEVEQRTIISLNGPFPIGDSVYVVQVFEPGTGMVDFEFNSILEAISFMDQRTQELLAFSSHS